LVNDRDAQSAVADPPRFRVAYLTGQYPLVSLTFILREVEALRALGLDVLTCSIRRTPPEQHPGPAEKQAAATTFYVLSQARNPIALLRAQAPLIRSPRRYLGALALAWRTRAPGLKSVLYQAAFFCEATILARHLQAERVDHLHNHFVSGSATVAMLVSELTGIPYSFTLHGPADLLEPYRWKLGEKTARARFVATISNYARSQLMFFSAPTDWPKIRIIHCGVQPSLYASDGTGGPEDGLRLLFVGRLAPVKGLRLFMEAMSNLLPRLPHLRLTIVGDGPDRKELEALALPLGDSVQFLGYRSQSDVAALMKASDIIVLPSLAEGVPVVLMEAMASAKPVIATQVAGVSELVEDGVNGCLVPPGSVEALVDAVLRLAPDKEARRKMGENGRRKVIRDFDIEIEASRLMSLLLGTDQGAVRPLSTEPESRANV
jgi:glycosyltransferase involved in cell wall biosynthesis